MNDQSPAPVSLEDWLTRFDAARTRPSVLSDFTLVDYWRRSVDPSVAAGRNDDIQWDRHCEGEARLWTGLNS